MAPVSTPGTETTTLVPADRIWWRNAPGGPRIIGYDRDGWTIWASAGGRGLGIDFAVDDRDGDDPDDFDEADDDDDEYEIEDHDNGGDEDDEDDRESDEDDRDPRARRRRERDREQRNKRDDDHGEDGWEPPSQVEWEKLREAQRRNNGELQRNRAARKIMQSLGLRDASEFANFLIDRGIDPDSGDPLDGVREDEDVDADGRRRETAAQHRRAEQRGAERESARWRPAVVQFAAADAFRDAGFSGGSLNRVLRLLDTDAVDVEFDDHGEVVVYGLDDQVKTIKSDLPELFRPRREPGRRTREEAEEQERPRPREGGRRITGARAVDGGDRQRPAPKRMGWLEKTDRAMRGLSPEPRSRRR